MHNYIFTDHQGRNYKRIRKDQARRAYLSGETIVICPCNIRPFGPWSMEYKFNKRMREEFVVDEIGAKNDFNNFICSFEYYNCQDAQAGKYTAFYKEV